MLLVMFLFRLLSLWCLGGVGIGFVSADKRHNHWDRNATVEKALGITDHHLISDKHIHMPRMFILGSQKCATTSLYDLFEHRHPNICNRFRKEAGYFDNVKSAWIGHLHRYKGMLRNNGTCQDFVDSENFNERTYNMDATPRYFDKPEVVLRMYHSYSRELRSQLKFLLILREPVAREFSWYNHNMRWCTRSMHEYMKKREDRAAKVANGIAVWNTTALCHDVRHCKASCRTHASRAVLGKEIDSLVTFAEAYRLGETDDFIGAYAVHLKRWLTYFKRSQFFIVNWETLLVNTTDTVERMTKFLEIPPFPKTVYQNGSIILPHEGPAGVNTTLDCGTWSALKKYYEPYNEQLYELLDRTRTPESLEPVFPKFRLKPCTYT